MESPCGDSMPGSASQSQIEEEARLDKTGLAGDAGVGVCNNRESAQEGCAVSGVNQMSCVEMKRETADRVLRLQQYRCGIWQLSFDFHAFQRWRRIGTLQGLGSDTDIACFLLQHYERSQCHGQSTKGATAVCSQCSRPLPLVCETCDKAKRGTSPHCAPSAPKELATSVSSKQTLGKLEEDCSAQTQCQTVKVKLKKKQDLSCSECDVSFTNVGMLKTHMRKHTGKRSYVCSTCGAVFSHASSLSVHRRTHTGHKPFVCEQCGAAFAVGSVLRQHVQSHSGEKPFRCKLCPSAFTQATKLTIHMRKHTGVRPYQCDQCGAAFTHNHRLTVHQRTHSGARPYHCPHCPRAFAQSAHLTVHVRLHTGARPYACPLCPAAFPDSTHLRRHQLTHTADKPHRCEDCGLAYATAYGLRRHQWSHGGREKPFKCGDCLKTFATNFCLKRHRAKRSCNSGVESQVSLPV